MLTKPKQNIEQVFNLVKPKLPYISIFLYYFYSLFTQMSDPRTIKGDLPIMQKFATGDTELQLLADSFRLFLKDIFDQNSIADVRHTNTRYPQLFFDAYFSHHIIVFILITSLLAILLLYSLVRIVNTNQTTVKAFIFFSILVFFPLLQMDSAGYFATLVEYFWALALFTHWISVLVRLYRKTSIKRFECIFSLFGLFVAVFEQQLCFTTLAVLVYTSIYLCFTKSSQILRQHIYFFVFSTAFSLMGIVNVIFSPGTKGRQIDDTEMWFPTFSHLSFARKFDGVFQVMARYYLLDTNIIICIIVLLLSVTLFYRRQYAIGLINSVILLFLVVPTTQSLQIQQYDAQIAKYFLVEVFNKSIIREGTGTLEGCSDCGVGYISQTTLNDPITLLPDIFIIVIVAIILLSIYSAYKKEFTTMHIYFCLLVASLSYSMMAASPTILASVDRPFIFGQLFLVFVVFLQMRWLFERIKPCLPPLVVDEEQQTAAVQNG